MKDLSVKRYLDGLAKSTAKNRLPLIESFFDYVGLPPTNAVEFQRKNPGSYRFVDLAYEFLDQNNLRIGSKLVKMGSIRGFFLANRVPLPKDKHRFHSDVPSVVGELTVDEFRKIVVASNPTYRAAFMAQFQMGGGIGELLYVNEHLVNHVWDEVKKGKRIIRLKMPGRKTNRNVHPYYSFIGSDAIDCLKTLFHNQGWKQDTVLFRTKRNDPISSNSLQTYFRRTAFRLDLIKRHTFPCLKCKGETVRVRRMEKGILKILYRCLNCHAEHTTKQFGVPVHVRSGIRYRMRTHEIRDLFRTEWHRAQRFFGVDPDVGNFCMGHTIDPLKYDKIMRDVSATLEQYRKAMPMLNILSCNSFKPIEVKRFLKRFRVAHYFFEPQILYAKCIIYVLQTHGDAKSVEKLHVESSKFWKNHHTQRSQRPA